MVKETCTIEQSLFEECPPEEGAGITNPCFDGICVEVRDGLLCPVDNYRSPWSLTENSQDSCLQDAYISEQLNIAGADLNVYKLLGVHEQGKLIDLTGDGISIAGGSHPNFPARNAFDRFKTEWRSLQLGTDIISKAFIGYDFGDIKLDNDRVRYGIETFVKHNITTVRIKQGCDSINRVTKVRLERSHDGERWFGVGVADVQDCDGLVTLNFNQSVPSRYWRIRPLEFNGGNEDYWSVQALQFIEYEKTNVDNIQDKIYMENRDLDFSDIPVKLKGSYQPFDSQSFFAKWGQSSGFGGEQYIIEVSWSEVVRLLGRPLVIGDIMQLPSETQYTATLTPVLKYVQITDVSWSPNGYSPQWTPLMLRVIASPAFASPETQDIFGDFTEKYDENGLANVGDGQNNKKYQDIADVDHTIRADANTEVPVRGEDAANVQKLSDEVYEWEDDLPEGTDSDISKIDRARNVFSQDGMPPNGEPFTQSDEFPTSPKDGDWHRLTYTKIRQGIPPRLYRYSADKGNWIYLETDRRAYASVIRPRLQDFEDPEQSTVTRPDEIDEDFHGDS
jgi:hypothetical protein